MTIHQILGAALLALGHAASAAEPICKSPQFHLGAGTHLGQNKIDLARAQLFFKYAKVDSFRDEFYWQRLEREQGVLKIPENLSDLDKVVRSHKSSGGPLPVIALNYGNRLYDQGDLPRSPEAIQAYSKYAEFVAQTYSDVAPIFEIWNEWNAGFGSKVVPRPKGSVEDYLRLMQGAVPRIRKASPNSLILAGATGNVDMKWSVKFAELGGLKSVDGFSIHPYNYKHHSKRSPEDVLNGLQELQENMSKAAGVSAVPFYLTELGVPSSTSKNGSPEEAVAIYALRFLLLARTQPYICGVWWYELLDSGPQDAEDEHRFGLFRQDGAAKPSAKALAKVAEFLREGKNFTQKKSGNVQSVSWRMPDGSEYVSYWAFKGTEVMPFDGAKYKWVELPINRDSAHMGDERRNNSDIAAGTTMSGTVDAYPKANTKGNADSDIEIGISPVIFKRIKP